MPNITKCNGFQGGSVEARLEALEGEFVRLSNELRFVLQNLGDENLNKNDLAGLVSLCRENGQGGTT